MTNSNKTINRRSMLAGATSLPMLALPAVVLPPGGLTQAAMAVLSWTSVPARQDPLYHAVSSCGFGLNIFSLVNEMYWPRVGGKQALIDGTYGPSLEVLKNWDEPALSLEGAIEALHFASEQCEHVSADRAIKPMVLAVLKFLEHVRQTQQA